MRTQSKFVRAILWDTGGILAASSRRGDGLSIVIRALRPYYHIALFCRSLTELQEALLLRWDLADAFERVILVEPWEGPLPPKLFSQAARGMNARPDQTLFIDAHADCLEAARSAGLRPVSYDTPAQLCGDLIALLQEPVA